MSDMSFMTDEDAWEYVSQLGSEVLSLRKELFVLKGVVANLSLVDSDLHNRLRLLESGR
jgi:hypothetical protein